jgi:hypothetical protein
MGSEARGWADAAYASRAALGLVTERATVRWIFLIHLKRRPEPPVDGPWRLPALTEYASPLEGFSTFGLTRRCQEPGA